MAKIRPGNGVYKEQVKCGKMTHREVLIDAAKYGFRLYWTQDGELKDAPSGMSDFSRFVNADILDWRTVKNEA